MGQKITKESIQDLAMAGKYREAHAAALKYEIAVREILDDNICQDSERFLFIAEHSLACRLLDELAEKAVCVEERAKRQAERERHEDLVRRMTSRWGTEYDNGCSEYHIDPEILAAAENVELGFDRKFQ
jgi:hypothetical protein